MKNKKLINSFKYAFSGIATAFKSEKNMKIHFTMMMLVIIFGILLKISLNEWLVCIMLFCMVIGSEMINTAVENVVNLAMPTKNEVAKNAKDNLGSYIAIGIAGILLFHFTENIGMTMGLLPITGVPLPFVSYGGSSLLTNLMMIGLLLNISGRRQKAIFID